MITKRGGEGQMGGSRAHRPQDPANGLKPWTPIGTRYPRHRSRVVARMIPSTAVPLGGPALAPQGRQSLQALWLL